MRQSFVHHRFDSTDDGTFVIGKVLPWMFGAIAGRALRSVYLRLQAKLAEWLRASFGKPPNRDRCHGVAGPRLFEYLAMVCVRGLGMVEQTRTVGGRDEIRIGK
jgi:hypothetical protein